jgi:hypothetical protein
LARRILRGVAASYSVFQDVKALNAAVEERKKAQPANTAEIEKQVAAVQDGTKAAPGLGPLNRDLTRLLNSVEAADQRPTGPQTQAVNEKCEALGKTLGLWKSFNDGLKAENLLKLPVATASWVGCGE